MEETDVEQASEGDEFNPTGTLFLLTCYVLLLVGLWIFMNFVEFIGKGPSITRLSDGLFSSGMEPMIP